jgi:hypothetical protein
MVLTASGQVSSLRLFESIETADANALPVADAYSCTPSAFDQMHATEWLVPVVLQRGAPAQVAQTVVGRIQVFVITQSLAWRRSSNECSQYQMRDEHSFQCPIARRQRDSSAVSAVVGLQYASACRAPAAPVARAFNETII